MQRDGWPVSLKVFSHYRKCSLTTEGALTIEGALLL